VLECSSRWSPSGHLIIPMIIRTTQLLPSGPNGTNDPPHLTSLDPTGADQSDAEHPPTDLAVGFESLAARSKAQVRRSGGVCLGACFRDHLLVVLLVSGGDQGAVHGDHEARNSWRVVVYAGRDPLTGINAKARCRDHQSAVSCVTARQAADVLCWTDSPR